MSVFKFKKGKFKHPFLIVAFLVISLLTIFVGTYLNSRELNVDDSYAAIPREERGGGGAIRPKAKEAGRNTTDQKAKEAGRNITKGKAIAAPKPVETSPFCKGSCNDKFKKYQETGLFACKPDGNIFKAWVPNCKDVDTYKLNADEDCNKRDLYYPDANGNATKENKPELRCKADKDSNLSLSDSEYIIPIVNLVYLNGTDTGIEIPDTPCETIKFENGTYSKSIGFCYSK